MPLRLDYPIFLLLVPLAVAAWFYTRHRVLSLWGWRRDLSGALRVVAATGFALALAQPAWPVGDDGASVAIAVDESTSMSPAALRDAQTWIDQSVRTRRTADRIGVVAFAGDTRVIQPLSDSDAPPRLPDPASLNPDASDPAQALRVAAGMVRGASNPRVVVISAGGKTSGDLGAALRQVGDVPVDVVPIARPPDVPEVQVESVQVPQYVRSGETFDGTVTVDSTEVGSGHVQVNVDGQLASEQDVQLTPGQNRVTFSTALLNEGFHSVAVGMSAPRDTNPKNNVGYAFTVVKPKPRVLVVEERENESAPIQNLLKRAQMTVEVRAPEGLPALTNLNGYAAVVLQNLSATSLSLDQQKTLQTYVAANGHGLVVLGGPTSYALGGYSDTTLEEMLPVLAKPPEKREGAQIALVLVIDRSASMGLDNGGVTRLGMAKEASILTASALKPEDVLGVLAFDKASHWIVRPDTVQNIGVQNVADQISSLTAEGGDGLYQALQEVYDALRASQADLKEMVLVNDGQADDVKYDDILARMRDAKIGLSVVAMGDDIDVNLMSKLARLGQGRYYATARLRDIPRVITQEAALAKRAALVEGTIQPQLISTSPILRGIAPNSIPTLSGHIATTPKDTAEIILASDEGAPLLAQWHYGLGRTVAWTSDVGGRWTTKWSDWEQNPRFWEQLVRWAMGPPINRDFKVDVTRTGNVATATVEDIADGKFNDLQALTLKVVGPGSAPSQVPLRQIAPGQYTATVASDTPGAYELDVSETPRPRFSARTEINGFVVPPVAATTSFVPNEQVLRRISSETGGNWLEPRAAATDLYRGTRTLNSTRWDPIWAYFAALGLIGFVLDVAVRRLRPSTLRALIGRSSTTTKG